MNVVLQVTGHAELQLGLQIREIEVRLNVALAHVQAIGLAIRPALD
ncbi:hypothetical protein [Altererythrobacter sp. Root672]|nr:hypothetical protein [Altererythrobacter sp. Root672]